MNNIDDFPILTTSDRVKFVAMGAVLGLAVTYSTIQLAKLGKDWVKEGIQTIKEKKNQK